MTHPEKPDRAVSITVGGSNYGALFAGNQNRVVVNAKTGATTTLTSEDMRTLTEALTALRDHVASDAPPDQRDAALRQVADLETSILPEPKVGRLQEIRDWFVKHAPALLGTVTTFFVNPILGKIVEASGEMAASAFRSHFAGQ
jgi:hypothetical protein